MTITLEVPPYLEDRAREVARLKGVSVRELLQAYLIEIATSRLQTGAVAGSRKQLSAEEVDADLEQAADLIPEGIRPLPDEAMSRESIYTREDDWNR